MFRGKQGVYLASALGSTSDVRDTCSDFVVLPATKLYAAFSSIDVVSPTHSRAAPLETTCLRHS